MVTVVDVVRRHSPAYIERHASSARTTKWLAPQRELLLPVPYVHIVLTLPSELRRLVRSHQRVLLGVLFRAAFESLAAL
jgi:hypothetical protein